MYRDQAEIRRMIDRERKTRELLIPDDHLQSILALMHMDNEEEYKRALKEILDVEN